MHEFQRIHYEEIPEIALVYPELLHAYRTDTFEGYVTDTHERWLAPLRMAGRLLHEPEAGRRRWAGAVADEGGMSTGLLVGIGGDRRDRRRRVRGDRSAARRGGRGLRRRGSDELGGRGWDRGSTCSARYFTRSRPWPSCSPSTSCCSAAIGDPVKLLTRSSVPSRSTRAGAAPRGVRDRRPAPSTVRELPRRLVAGRVRLLVHLRTAGDELRHGAGLGHTAPRGNGDRPLDGVRHPDRDQGCVAARERLRHGLAPRLPDALLDARRMARDDPADHVRRHARLVPRRRVSSLRTS